MSIHRDGERTAFPRAASRPALFAASLLAALGCAAPNTYSAPSWSPPPAAAPARAELVRPTSYLADEDTAALSDPLRVEVRADRSIGQIARRVASLREALERARAHRDVVLFACINAKVDEVERAERDAHAHLAALRAALLEDDAAARAAYDAIVALAQRALVIASTSSQCLGNEDSFAQQADDRSRGGEGNAYVIDGASTERLRSLELAVAKREEAVFRSKARTALLEESVLAQRVSAPSRRALASPGGGAPPPLGQPGAGAPPMAALPQPSPPPPANVATSERDDPHDASMLIRTAELVLAVFEVEKNMDAVERQATEAGGYLAERSDRQVVVRVPRERFEEVLRGVEKLGDVLHRNVSAEDVTDQFVDLEMRLKNAEAVRARLEKLLEGASVKDAVEIHKELAKITDEIERLKGKLKLLKNRIGYSTIVVAFQRAEVQPVRARALLPFPWMSVMGLGPLLDVRR